MSMRMKVRTVKSKPSNIHPRKVAMKARFWSLVSARYRLVVGGWWFVVTRPWSIYHQRVEFLLPDGIFYLAARHPLRTLGGQRSVAAGISDDPDPPHRRHGDRRWHMC